MGILMFLFGKGTNHIGLRLFTEPYASLRKISELYSIDIYLGIEDFNMIIFFCNLLNKLITKIIKCKIITLKLSPEVSALGIYTC
jgi:hypothetical protein